MVENPREQQPIFLLGTGRCGSTFLQRSLSSLESIWIWGEHDGLLIPHAGVLKLLQESSALSKFHFDSNQQGTTSDLKYHPGDATDVAWMNGFNRQEVLAATAVYVQSLFSFNLPLGKTIWGFKEVRYGPDNNVPRMLLELFPRARIIYTVRRAFQTAESSLAAWNPNLLQDAESKERLGQVRSCYARYINRWINYSEYFLELAEQFKGSVFVARLEDSERQFGQMCAFLEQPFDEVVQNEMKLPFNDNPRSTQLLGAAAIRKSLEECRTQFNMDVGAIEAKLGY